VLSSEHVMISIWSRESRAGSSAYVGRSGRDTLEQ
jgi:hypothetical protein